MADPLIETVKDSLWREVLDRWFPVCVRPAGGFHQYLDRAWVASGGDDRFLVFQARMTWTCANIAAAGGGSAFAELARHGVAMLARMTHAQTGALYWETDIAGRATGRHSRGARSYGQAFAIFALAAAAKALDSQDALAAAKRVFAWLEQAHHDRRNGGYFEYVRFSGRPVFRTRRLRRHVIGGFKTSNSHLHLLEAFVDLYRLWPDAILRHRIEELIELLTMRWWIEPGRINGDAWLNNEPIVGKHSYGHDLEVAHLLLDVADALGRPEDPWLLGRAEALLHTALAESWDEARGGFFDRQIGPDAVPGLSKIWWVQAEGLACLAALSAAGRGRRELLERQWRWIERRQIDAVHGGWFETIGPDEHPVGDLSKGKPWKEIYHEVRAALVLAQAFGARPEAVLRRD